MRILSPEFMNKNISTEREPIIVVKIINDNKNIYLTSHPVTIVDAGSSQFQGCIVSATGSSQSIVPERGFSTIGDMSITLQDVDGAFTAELRSILNNFSDTINNNKSEFYTGLGDMLFQDYVKITPVWVSGIANSDLEYTLTFSDTQRLTKASLFKAPAKTELVNSPLFATENISLEVISTADFNDVLHDDNWEYAPGKRVGYVKVTGVTESGESAKEIMQWEGKTTTHLQNIKRQLFDTPLVNLNGEDKVEIEEVIYLDLSVPKMIIALLTGDLYGQAGEGIPDSWNSGVSADLIDIDSYENIGQDLWEQQVAFVDIDKQTAKEFIASQLLAPYGLFNYINQNGELQLRRFGFQSQDSSSDIVLSYESLTSVSNISRDFKKIRNNFLINWEWRPDKDFYARKDGYIDVVSQEKFNIKSDTYEIKLRGLKNRSKGSKPTLDYVAQGIATRFSNPSINITAEGLMRDMIAIEVGDTVTIDLPNQPDYASADSLLASFEVQGMSWDFLQGTQSLKLFTSSGAPSEFGITSGSSISSIGHAGWTSLIGSGYGSVNGEGEFVFNSTSTIPTGKYYFDGDVKFPDSSITTISKDFFLDASTIRMGVSAVIDGVGTGGTGKNYFGGQDAAQEGLYQDKYGFLDGYQRFRRNQNTQSPIDASNTSIDLSKITRLTNGEPIDSFLPLTLSGNGGGRGGNSRVENITDPAGGSPSSGGGGCMFVCDSFFFENSSVINLSGNPSNLGAVGIRSSMAWHAGSSGYGWPGVFICALKDRYAPEPFLYNLVVAKTGEWTPIVKSYSNDPLYPWGSGDYRKHTPGNTDYISSPPPAASQANKNFASEGGTAIKVIRFIQADDFVPAPGVDLVPRSLAPGLALQVAPNTPRTPGGDQSTITMTATANPSDSSYSYAKFEYRILGQSVWYPVSYKIKSEATITVASNGLSYEIKATSYGLDKRSGASTISTIAVGFVSQDPRYSSGGLPSAPEDIKVPAIKRLELINRLGNATDWDKFKSPDAEFKWAKTSVTAGGNIITTSGHRDLHLTGYKVRIFRPNGQILREETVTDSYYVYTFEKNKKDTVGYPIREFKIDVQPVSSTGFTVTPTSITVSNPAPAAVLNPAYTQAKDGINISYSIPSDADFVGIRIRDKVYTGSSVTIDPSTTRDEVLTLVSVDQFGDGGSVLLSVPNPAPVAVTDIEWIQTKEGIAVSYVLPNDVDLIGVRVRDKIYTGSSITIAPSTVRSESISITPVDGVGDGAVNSFIALNPEPAAPTGISIETGITSAKIGFVQAVDFDLIGTAYRYGVYVSGSSTTYGDFFEANSNQIVLEGLSNGTDYEIEFKSVDTLGGGPPTSVIFQTASLVASEIEGLGNWATATNPVDSAFITANMEGESISGALIAAGGITNEKLGALAVDASKLASGAVIAGKLGSLAVEAANLASSSVTATKIANLAVGNAAIANAAIDSAKIASLAVGTAAIQDLAVSDAKIGSLTASKITTGTLAATQSIQVGNTTDGGVLLTAGNGVDEGGYIQTIAPTVEGTSNYLMTMGPHIVGTDVYSLSASDGLTTPFFINIDGSAKFGKLALSANGAISSDNFSIAENGSAEFTGVVTVQAGSNVAAGADVTQTALNGTTTMGAGTLHLEGSNANIAIGDSITFGTAGIQLQYNEVSSVAKPQFYAGDGSESYIKYTTDGSVEIKGQIVITGGSGIASLTDAGALASEDSVAYADTTGTKPPSDADKTQTALEASTTMGAGTLHLNGTSANIAIGAATTWASNGIQLQYNSGTPRAHIGSTTNYIRYDGTNLIVATNAIGSGSSIGTNSVAFGSSSNAFGYSSVAIGVSTTSNYNSVAIGNATSATGYSSVAIGTDTDASAQSVSIGYNSSANNIDSIAIGTNAFSSNKSISIGYGSSSTSQSIAIGYNAIASHINSTAIGLGAASTAGNQVRIGNSTQDVSIPGDLIVSSDLQATTITSLGSLSGGAISGASASITNHLGASTIGATTGTFYTATVTAALSVQTVNATSVNGSSISSSGVVEEYNTALSSRYAPITRTYIEVGAYAFLKSAFTSQPANVNETYAGTYLRFSDANNNNGGAVSVGTWLCCGQASNRSIATLYQRIA